MFFEGYTGKLWGRHHSNISADWGAQRVKGLSTVGYGYNACILNWDTAVWSEALAISFSGFFLYTVVKYMKSMSVKDGINIVAGNRN